MLHEYQKYVWKQKSSTNASRIEFNSIVRPKRVSSFLCSFYQIIKAETQEKGKMANGGIFFNF